MYFVLEIIETGFEENVYKTGYNTFYGDKVTEFSNKKDVSYYIKNLTSKYRVIKGSDVSKDFVKKRKVSKAEQELGNILSGLFNVEN